MESGGCLSKNVSKWSYYGIWILVRWFRAGSKGFAVGWMLFKAGVNLWLSTKVTHLARRKSDVCDFVSPGCYNRINPQARWIFNNRNIFPQFWRPGGPRARPVWLASGESPLLGCRQLTFCILSFLERECKGSLGSTSKGSHCTHECSISWKWKPPKDPPPGTLTPRVRISTYELRRPGEAQRSVHSSDLVFACV